MSNFTEIRVVVVRTNQLFEGEDELHVARENGHVVDINKDDSDVSPFVRHEENRDVSADEFLKPILTKRALEVLKPLSTSLFETVDGLFEAANEMFLPGPHSLQTTRMESKRRELGLKYWPIAVLYTMISRSSQMSCLIDTSIQVTIIMF